MESGSENTAASLATWDPFRYLRRIDTKEVELSRGFLRCRPEKWFPGFAAQWLPLAHALGVEFRVSEIQAALSVPANFEIGYAASVDGEHICVMIDQPSAKALLDNVVSGGNTTARSVALEYLARRFISSLALSWSGPDSSTVLYDMKQDAQNVKTAGAVKFSFLINNNSCTVWLGLGLRMVQRLDGLWRRQLKSSNKNVEALKVSVEIGQLAVPQSTLSDYTGSGTVVDLEIPVSDMVTLRVADKPWLPAKLCNVDGNLAIEVIPGAVSNPALPEGTTRLSFRLANLNIDASSVTEITQMGAVYTTQQNLGNEVEMYINNEKIGEATLCVYEGRFAISVK